MLVKQMFHRYIVDTLYILFSLKAVYTDLFR